MKGCLPESISQVLRSLQNLDPFTLTESLASPLPGFYLIQNM